MALWPTPQESCFYLDPNAGLDDAGNWRDLSPYQLNVLPVGYAAPAFGIFTGPSGAKAISFNGANQYGELPAVAQARFYANAPTSLLTCAIVARHANPLVVRRFFDCRNAGGTRGFVFDYSSVSAERVDLLAQGGGVGPEVYDTADAPLSQRTRVSIVSIDTINAANRGIWHDRNQVASTRVVGSSAIEYDTAIPVRVGCYTAAVNFLFTGDLYCLSIYNRVWSDAESKAFSDFWLNRT